MPLLGNGSLGGRCFPRNDGSDIVGDVKREPEAVSTISRLFKSQLTNPETPPEVYSAWQVFRDHD
jgi:hypothetical protein